MMRSFARECALRSRPDYHAARYDYAVVLLKRHKHARAGEEIERLLSLEPRNRVYRTTEAAIAMGLGDYERALPLYRNCWPRRRRIPELHLSVAHALKTLGRTPEAIESYRAAAHGQDRPTARPTGVSPTSRPIVSRTRNSRACEPTRRRRRSRPSTAITCASRSARRSRTGAITASPSPVTSAATR